MKSTARRDRDDRPGIARAWQAWRMGDFAEARKMAEATRQGNPNEAGPILVLAAHARGDYAGALDAYYGIEPRYRYLSELDEAVLWSYVWLGDIAGANAFAQLRRLTRNPATREQLRLAGERPLKVEISGDVELPFTDDAFSDLFPGIAARVNGKPVIARLDTGGSFLHVSRTQAQALGIRFAGCERGFAALMTGAICYSVADLELGSVRLANVPVAVLPDRAVPLAATANAFDSEFGTVIGTNVFRQFLTTIDAPGRRLVLSKRGDKEAGARHMARVGQAIGDVAFGVLGDHMIVARGRVEDRPIVFFVDSGLAAFRKDQGQAAILASDRVLRDWGVFPARGAGFAELPMPVELGPLQHSGLFAFPVSHGAWRRFGDWSGVGVDALISHGFLKHHAWTIDFDRGVLMFHSLF